jgi:prepilin-type N-terminal cleavage/methylation domain-containing protein
MRGAFPSARRSGFTLIELLVVIGILSLLMVALLPMIAGAVKQKEVVATEARLQEVTALIEGMRNTQAFGDAPADDMTDNFTYKTLKLRNNRVNAGIESLVQHLHRKELLGNGLVDKRSDTGYFGNTDNDQNEVANEKLESKELYEVLDSWGNPLAYFHNRNYGNPQDYRTSTSTGTGETVTVRAWRDQEGRFINPHGYQLFSSGADGVYGTDDDVALFTIPKKKE